MNLNRTKKIACLRNMISVRRRQLQLGLFIAESHKVSIDGHFEKIFQCDPDYNYSQAIKLSMEELKQLYGLLPEGDLKDRLGTHCYPLMLPKKPIEK